MTIITEISFMLPTKLQYVYDYIHNHSSQISYDQFTKFLSQLHVIPNGTKFSETNTNKNDVDSEFLHHIFSTYQLTSQSQDRANGATTKGECWLAILSKPNNGCSNSINSQKFINAITNCNIQSMSTISRHRSGFSAKLRRNDLLSPRTSLRNIMNTITNNKSDTNSIENKSINTQNEADQPNEIATDSDLDDNQFGILKKLPTWKKLKLSVYERRQRWRRKQKTIQRLKRKQQKTVKPVAKTPSDRKINKIRLTKPRSTEWTGTAFTYSDLDFSSTDNDFDDIIKGPSPPPRKMMSAELKAMCGNLINELLSSPRSFYFSDYFPFHKWGLTDYNDYFSANYLHLNLVKQQLERDEYETPGLFAAAVRTIFNNATLYHWDGAKQYRIKVKAMLLTEEFEEKYLDILAEDEVSQKIRQQLIHSQQQREEKRVEERKHKISSTSYEACTETGDYSGSDGDIEDESDDDDEYSVSRKTHLTHHQSSTTNTSITMNSIAEQKQGTVADGDEICEMLKKLQQLTDVTDVQTMKETNDYINNIRLELMIAQKISRESPRLQKMRFLKQLHASQLLMEKKQRDMISYRTKNMTPRNNYNTFFPDENYTENAWNRRKNISRDSSITSRGSHTFIRAHDLSIRYAVNFPKSITIKANKRIVDDNEGTALSKTVSVESVHSVAILQEGDESETEFEQLPSEMTDEKLIEEHTDDLWAAMPLVPVDILEKAVSNDGVTFVESECIVCNDFSGAQHLLTDEYFAYTYSYVKGQFMAHFGQLRVGRDVFVDKLHYIFDSHQELSWLRLNLTNYYVTPKSILPMECMNDTQMNATRNALYGLLQILQPTAQSMSAAEVIYQHKLYLYQLLKLSGVILVDEHEPDLDEYDEFILSLDELWALTDDQSDSDIDGEDHLDVIEPFGGHGADPLLSLTKTKSKPGSTPVVVCNTFSFADVYETRFASHDMNDNRYRNANTCDNDELIPFINSESDEAEEIIPMPLNGTDYAHQAAMNENYAGNHHQNGPPPNDNDNTNNNVPNEQQNSNDMNGNTNNSGQGDDGDEKKNNDNVNRDDIENKHAEAEQKEEQDIEIVDAPLNDNESFNRTQNIVKGLAVLFVAILAIIFGIDFVSMGGEHDPQRLSALFEQAQDFIAVYDTELIGREKRGEHIVLYSDEIPADNPCQTWINGLHVGSLIDALDIEKKWYTGYVTNVDVKTGLIKIHYDDWSLRFNEWVDPQSGKIAPYRSRAIGGRFQGGLPGRPALPIRPQNDSGLSAFSKMKISLSRQQKPIPDVILTVNPDTNGKLSRYAPLLEGIFYEMGIVCNERAVYMNHHKMYIFYVGDKWCVCDEYGQLQQSCIICIESDALRPELIAASHAFGVAFEKSAFAPAYLWKSNKKFTPIGSKGLKSIPKVKLNNQVMLPQVIVGTAMSADVSAEDVRSIISAAAQLGYYMFDTGTQSMADAAYFNHKYINNLFKMYGRATIGVSTKIAAFAHGYHAAIHNFLCQLHTLGTDYIDLVVIEHPQCLAVAECEGNWLDTWRALEYLYEKKRIRALGVAQFNVSQLTALIRHKQKHVPLSVVRDWRDPLHSSTAVLQWCNANNIVFQAFSPLGGQHLAKNNGIVNPVLNHPTLTQIASSNGMEAAQVVISWNMMRNVGVILKTTDIDHLSENLDSFSFAKLTDEELYEIDMLGFSKSSKTQSQIMEKNENRIKRKMRRQQTIRNRKRKVQTQANQEEAEAEAEEESVELMDDL